MFTNRTSDLSRREFGPALTSTLLAAGVARDLIFCCSAENDLYRALSPGRIAYARYNDPEIAVARAKRGAGVLLLADRYPDAFVHLSPRLLAAAREKKLKLFAEFVQTGAEMLDRRISNRERGVVASDFFGAALPKLSILALHACHYVPLPARLEDATLHLVLAKVAGFNKAVFGLPSHEVFPLLAEYASENLLLTTTQLSRFRTARYAPAAAWTFLWRRILAWLGSDASATSMKWEPTVRPRWSSREPLPDDAEKTALKNAAEWYFRARLFVHPSWAHKLEAARKYPDSVAPAPSAAMPVGNGTLGLLEGHSSKIELDGSQPARWWIRADCVGETAMVLAMANRVAATPKYMTIANNLLDFLLFSSRMSTGARLDPSNVAYGLLGWNETKKYFKDEDGFDVYYGDDNARCLLGSLATAALTGQKRWQQRIWLAILANFRLVGTLGYQRARYDQAPLSREGWRHIHNSPIVLNDLNYQAYPWALFLWAFSQTKFQPFFDRCEMGIRQTVQAYPNQWRWSNSITSQQARFILPLAWLVRVKDTQETRGWLKRFAQELLAHQDRSGGIYEWTGPRGTGIQVPPTSNEQYGAGEGSLIQENGDPVADLLYAMNFAFIGLHEAYHATGDAFYKTAGDRIADLLIRAQVRSNIHPQFDGAWYRAFDFKRWEYWGSNSDSGWGAWCTESGWSQSWISVSMSLRLQRKSLWEILQQVPPHESLPNLMHQMLGA